MALDPQTAARLQAAFAEIDSSNSGFIPSAKLEELLRKAGRDASTATGLLKTFDPSGNGALSFEQVVAIASARSLPAPVSSPGGPDSPRGGAGMSSEEAGQSKLRLDEDSDPKVEEFLKVLEEYRSKCEGEGNYEEAARATDQLANLRKGEEGRRIKALKARFVSERQQVSAVHNQQYTDFNAAWDRYLAEYDAMAAMYVNQMQERHTGRVREFQEQLHQELLKRPVKFGRELLDWRSREAMLVKQRKYGEAARIKAVADELERKERARMDEERLASFAQREAKFRAQQAAELSALLKRIETRRVEHCKQRELDSKRLLQRNKNMMAVLEARQANEEQRKVQEIRQQLAPPRQSAAKLEPLDTGSSRRSMHGSDGASSAAASSARAGVGASAAPSASRASGGNGGLLASPGSRNPGHARSLVQAAVTADKGAGFGSPASRRR